MADIEERAEENVEPSQPDAIDKIGRERFQMVLNILTESPFFYADDDPVRFNVLRRNEAAFKKFFEKYFGWRLYVDSKMARLIKDRNYNPALRSVHRDTFRLSGRNECLLFLVLLEYYEHECDVQGYSNDDVEPLRFAYADFLTSTRRILADQIVDQLPADREIEASARQLLKKLQHFRLVAVVDVADNAGNESDGDMLIEVLPGLNCYEGRKLAEALGRDEADPEILDDAPDSEEAVGDENE
ncbi:MAG: hypothetical protein CVV41_05875 [Candidatus Riflebacteria bacterium HGW-Riflebacteria-1]|jgi:hypothetical protein|nr:MAG: hypothetical protein CVV41_05875 [Candidatus Riflebacteria bacterium HGW-Riflebacteria-1]